MSEYFHTAYVEACHEERRRRVMPRRAARMGEDRWLRLRALGPEI